MNCLHHALAHVARIFICVGTLSWACPGWSLPANMTQGSIYTAAGTGIAGLSGDGGDARQAQIAGAQGVAVDRNGNLYIADSANNRIRKVTPSGVITTIAGVATITRYFAGSGGYSGDGGPASEASLNNPVDVAVDSTGNVYVADQGNNRVRKIGIDGKIWTVAGNGNQAYSDDGGPATMTSITPTAVAVDAAGNLYVADSINKRIRKITDGIVTNFAGNGTFVAPNVGGPATPAMVGDGGPATSSPMGLVTSMAFDSAGNLYFSDHDYHRIRKVSNGIITTIAGTGHWQAERNVGSATNVAISRPYGIAIDDADNIYVASGNDYPNHNVRFIRKITNGTISLATSDGGNGPFTEGQSAFSYRVTYEPRGLAIDKAGNLYIAQYQLNPRENDYSRVFVVATTASATSIVGLSVSCPATISTGASANCSATVTYGNGSAKLVAASWASSDPAATMNGNTLTANSFSGDTLVTISASYTEGGTTKTASQVVTIKSASAPTLPENIDCFFNWAEANLSTLFNPPAGPSQTTNQYQYRYYSGSNMYLAVATDTLRVLYAGELSGGSLLDLGPFEAWKAKACTAGIPNTGNSGPGSGSGTGSATVAITSAVIPNVAGTAKAGTTIILTATNTATGEVRLMSSVTGADGKWTLTLSGLPDGSYELQPEANGVKGNKVTVVVDTQAPISTLSLTSNYGPNPLGWYAGLVNLAITTADSGGQGIALTDYTLNGGVQSAFPASGLTLSADGSHTFCYRSVDKAGNAEPARCVIIAIDATKPVINPVFDATGNTLNLNAQDITAGIASVEISLDGGVTWTTQAGPTTFTQDGSQTVQYRVRDNAGNLTAGQTTVSVMSAPVVTAPTDQSASEAASQIFNLGSFSDQAADGPWTIDIDWGDASTHDSLTANAAGSLGALSHTYADNGIYTVTIKVTDKAGNTATKASKTTVANIAPTATFTAATGTLDEGGTGTFAFTNPADPSSADTQAGFHYAFACDGVALTGATYANSGTNATTTCTLNNSGNQTIRARIIDKDNGFTEYTAAVVVNNIAPTAMLSANGPVNEGGVATISFSNVADASSGDAQAGFRYAFACDGGSLDGATYANSGQAATASCVFDDNGNKLIRARLIDKDGGFTEYTTNVVVNNVAPTAVFSASASISEAGTATLTLNTPLDPSIADMQAGFRYAFACDGASLAAATYANSGTSASTSCAFADNSNYTVRARIIDKDNGFTEYTAVVVVNNNAPTATFTVNGPINEGASATLTFSNPGDATPDAQAGFRYAFACDGAALAAATYANSGTNAVTICPYPDGPGTNTVRARIIDKDGGFTEYTANIVVNNIAPVAGSVTVPTAPVNVNTVVNVSASLTDAGILDTHTATIDWGDGSSISVGTVTENNGSGSVTGNHSYAAAGSYTVTITVTDKDGGIGSAISQSIAVINPGGASMNGNAGFNSPSGAMPGNSGLAGAADVQVMAKYNGSGMLSGSTTFNFSAGGLDFKSMSYDWLVASGNKAMVQGTGTINGGGSYGFIVSAIDGGKKGPDLARVKIWNKATGQVVYDSQPGAANAADPDTPVSSGKITIQ